jgi:NAD-dependent dihydropyrimidine dehydrogenase PreA subunit
MNSHHRSDVTAHIVEKAKILGASLAGITSIDSLKDSDSYKIYGDAEWPHHEKTVLVLALIHEETEPENEPQKDSPSICIQYCRACELACPIGR